MRRALNILLFVCVAAWLAAMLATAAVGTPPRGGRQPDWVRALGWAGVASMPLIFLLACVKMFGWVLGQFAHFRGVARLGAGRCPTCGYDLRASPRRCPECGAGPGPAK